MKILVGLNNKEIQNYLNYTNSFIIGLKDFSVNYVELTKEEIKKVKEEYPKIELFVSINKNIFNDDLEALEENLRELNKLQLAGILFYDLSVLSLVKKNHLSIPLVWNEEHMTTNYNTCNYYYHKGCQYVYLASEITTDEIREIKAKSPIKLMSFFYGYPEVSFTKRKLLTNYFLHYHEKKDSDVYLISSDDNHKYYIKESKLGTRIMYGHIMNGIKPFYELRDILDYAILCEDLMDHDVFMQGLSVYKDLLDGKIEAQEAEKKIYEITNSDDTVFYYKKTIYKVKDEKN